ncbi:MULTISPECIES: type VI secretion system contractile sheath small subunit [Arcobacter]|jgi:type VI secretion system protein ImpB|uniref:Type VI secretion system, tubular sheath protein n=1 Tax=Arcobacter defluvii TaxID=873191 RepID=A0AAE7BFS2_9BACT|nr:MULTISPECIES: type VI secretion system contractile sheath small subunit [Arcobacter]MDY0051159.1 type VI secretion system contractile sheath small subunit [Aliarcobacter sp.]QKF78268.1 type VI secretion system, tubular sheath protein [Arcobacter defluvii]RXI29075.1 type VI secretion system contractile sheath small subunit [Arcobacter defluvii]BAK74065.1 conserved hypothetical protein [Arcobacter sp. L]
MKQSESPKERINVTYKHSVGEALEDIEIPYKMTILGEFNPSEERKSIEEKKTININKNNFNEVIKAQNLKLNFDVKNRLNNSNNDSIKIDLDIKHISDFSPEKIVEKVPELKKLMELRQSLIALKGPLGNVPAFRKAIESLVQDTNKREQLLSELNLITKDNN